MVTTLVMFESDIPISDMLKAFAFREANCKDVAVHFPCFGAEEELKQMCIIT